MLKINQNNRKYSIRKLSRLFNGAVLFTLISFTPISFSKPIDNLISNNPKEVIDQVWQIIYRDYLDYSGDYQVDDWIRTRKNLLSSNYESQPEAHKVIRSMLKSLNDPYTRFLDPKEFTEMRIDTSGELMGVGIQISVEEKTNKIIVVSPIEGTPAYKAGIKSKDVIVSINGKLTDGMAIDNAVKLIRGKKGTSVKLGLLRDNESIEVNLIRDRIEITAVNRHLNQIGEDIQIGYIRLKQFNANSVREMRIALTEFEEKKASAYVLDLRGNPGGLLEASIEIARLWIDSGIIVSTKTKDGINEVRRANGRSITAKPVVVLINEGSASASEILSGAIQDNKRGILVGKTTFGKGLVQSVRALSDGSGMTVTIAKYLTPNKRDINKNGIKPDIEVELDLYKDQKISYDDLGTMKDSQYLVAENELVKLLKKQDKLNSYIPKSANLKLAFR